MGHSFLDTVKRAVEQRLLGALTPADPAGNARRAFEEHVLEIVISQFRARASRISRRESIFLAVVRYTTPIPSARVNFQCGSIPGFARS